MRKNFWNILKLIFEGKPTVFFRPLLLLLLLSPEVYAENGAAAAKFRGKKAFEVKIKPPEGFVYRKAPVSEPLGRYVSPFDFENDYPLTHMRYISGEFPLIAFAVVVSFREYKKLPELTPEVLAAKNVEMINSGDKLFGTEGKFYFLRQLAHGVWYYKYIATFDLDGSQTAVIAGVYPETLAHHRIIPYIKQTVEQSEVDEKKPE